MSVTRKNGATLKAEEKRDLILICLRDTRCAMTAVQVREWLQEHKRTSLPEHEVATHLKILEAAGKAAHPSPTNTTQYKAVGR